MKSELSEFSYGYSIIREFENRLGPNMKAVPLLPSLRKEKKLGYDVKIVANKSIFLQFKLSQYMTKRAREGAYMKGAYYRFNLDNISQFFALLNLSQIDSGNIVRYVAPLFHKLDEFNIYFFNDEVIKHSIFIPPTAIFNKKITVLMQKHKVVYNSNDKFFIFSEPYEISLKDEMDIFKAYETNLKYISIYEYILQLTNIALKLIENLKEKYEYMPYNGNMEELATYFENKLSESRKNIDNIENTILLLSKFYPVFTGIIPHLIVNYGLRTEYTEEAHP